MTKHAWLAALGCALLAGCLEPRASDRAGYSSNLGKESVPAIEKDKLLGQKIATNSGVMGPLVPLRSGFANGHELHYWDFGATTGNIKPAWIFRKRNKSGELEDFGHPALVDSIPGDMSYSPLRALYVVVVTDAYDGERIASPQALEDALELGLVTAPKPTGTYEDWPIVPAGTQLDMGTAVAPVEASALYYRGNVTRCFQLGSFELPMMGPVPTPNAYLLRRRTESRPLDEAQTKSDLNGDMDMLDTNTVFALDTQQPGYSALFKQVDVVVPADYEFGAARAESDLFVTTAPGTRSALPERVVEFTESMTLLNRPMQTEVDDEDGGR